MDSDLKPGDWHGVEPWEDFALEFPCFWTLLGTLRLACRSFFESLESGELPELLLPKIEERMLETLVRVTAFLVSPEDLVLDEREGCD